MKNEQLAIKNQNAPTRKYPSYKDSGIEWLGEVPAHWEVRRLKEIISESVYGISEKTNESGKYEVLGMGDIDEGRITFPQRRFIDEIPTELLVKKGDMLFNRTNSVALVGKVGLIEIDIENVTFASYLIRLRFNKKTFNKYYWYSLNSEKYIAFARSHSIQTANQANLSSSKLNFFKVPLPPLPEQIAIANYLDTHTAKIDKKVELLTKKATLYANLKQSLINETVTRGLSEVSSHITRVRAGSEPAPTSAATKATLSSKGNTTPKMKDSGIDWLGEVPEHWEVKRVKDIFIESKNKVGLESSKYKVLSLTMKGVIIRDLENNKGKMPASFDGYQIVKKNNLIFCLFDMDVTPMIVGIAEQEGIITSAYTIIKYNPRISMNYFYYYFLAQNYNKSLLAKSKTLRSTLTFDTFSLVSLPLPPLHEQAAIADYLDNKTKSIDRIIEKIQLQIDKLKELRKALINDVVTGKIRVADNG